MRKQQKVAEQEQRYGCSICKKQCTGYSNNAYPVNSGRCCNECNATVVIPARIKAMRPTPDNDAELRQLMDGFLDADEAGDKAGYLTRLPPAQRDKLLGFLADEIERELRKDLN